MKKHPDRYVVDYAELDFDTKGSESDVKEFLTLNVQGLFGGRS